MYYANTQAKIYKTQNECQVLSLWLLGNETGIWHTVLYFKNSQCFFFCVLLLLLFMISMVYQCSVFLIFSLWAVPLLRCWVVHSYLLLTAALSLDPSDSRALAALCTAPQHHWLYRGVQVCVCVCLTLQCCSSRHSGCVAGGLCCKQTTTPPSHSGSPTARLLVRLSSGSGMASPGSASGSKRNSCKWHLSFFHCWWLKYLLTCSASVIPHGLFVDVCAGKRLLIGISDNSCLLDLDYFVSIWRAEIVGGVL